MKVIAITSGKGGVGKTTVSANLAIALAGRDQRVTVFDADIGLANLDVMLGRPAKGTLQQVISGAKSLADVIEDGPGGIKFVGGGSGIETLINLTGRAGDAFLRDISDLERTTDFLIFDTGAGIDANVMAFLSAADEVFVVITPDPASLTDGYATAKAIITSDANVTVKILMNMVDDEAHAKAVFARLTSIAQQFLGVPFGYAGYIRVDAKAAKFVRQRKPWMLADPHLPASRDTDRIAAEMLGEVVAVHAEPLSFSERLRGLFARDRAA
ncbi:MAG: MinD/ParA family protein [Fimbriimonadaceae bacterium]